MTERVQHPWIRVFARTLDCAIYGLILTAVWNGVFRMRPDYSWIYSKVFSFSVLAMMLLLEPVFLMWIGTTPGKWMFGLRLLGEDGEKLTYSQGLSRTWGVIRYGLGFQIPFYEIYRWYKSYQGCSKGELLPWEDEETYTLRDTNILRAALFGGAEMLILFCSVMILFNAELPMHRGEINTAEFPENYNDYLSYYNVYGGKEMNADGKWVDKNDNSYWINLSDLPLPDFEISETDGAVTKVKFEVESDQAKIISSYQDEMLIAIMSYVGAQPGMTGLHLENSDLLHQLKQNEVQSFSFSEGGIKVSCDVDNRGYFVSTSGTLVDDGSADRYFHMSFTMERV